MQNPTPLFIVIFHFPISKRVNSVHVAFVFVDSFSESPISSRFLDSDSFTSFYVCCSPCFVSIDMTEWWRVTTVVLCSYCVLVFRFL